MKRILLFGLLFIAIKGLSADTTTAPCWLDEAFRLANYPHDAYINSFVIGECSNGETIESALQRIRDNARVEAVSNLITNVESNTSHQLESKQVSGTIGFEEIIHSNFSQSTTLHSSMKDIPNLTVESWHNTKTNEIYAFAWVKKTELARTLKKQLISTLTRAEMALEEAERLNGEGEKIAARKAVEQVITYLQQVEERQNVVLAVDLTANMEDIVFAESNALKQRVIALQQQLKNGITIYIGGEVNLFEKDYPTFIQQIKQEVGKIGCTFTTNEVEADWIIRLQGKVREEKIAKIQEYTAFVVMAEVDMELAKKGQIIYAGNVSKKGVHTVNIESAAKEAYTAATKETAEKLNEIINN